MVDRIVLRRSRGNSGLGTLEHPTVQNFMSIAANWKWSVDDV